MSRCPRASRLTIAARIASGLPRTTVEHTAGRSVVGAQEAMNASSSDRHFSAASAS
jgi:hypothetical protein